MWYRKAFLSSGKDSAFCKISHGCHRPVVTPLRRIGQMTFPPVAAHPHVNCEHMPA